MFPFRAVSFVHLVTAVRIRTGCNTIVMKWRRFGKSSGGGVGSARQEGEEDEQGGWRRPRILGKHLKARDLGSRNIGVETSSGIRKVPRRWSVR
jgi:hypothetical protein